MLAWGSGLLFCTDSGSPCREEEVKLLQTCDANGGCKRVGEVKCFEHAGDE